MLLADVGEYSFANAVVNDPNMHHGTCVMHVPWCMSGSLTSGGGENIPIIPCTCATRNFTYLARGPWKTLVSIIPGNGLSHVWCKPITQTNADVSPTGPLVTKFSDILITIQTFSLKKYISKYCLQNGSHFVWASICLKVQRVISSIQRYISRENILLHTLRPGQNCSHRYFQIYFLKRRCMSFAQDFTGICS